MHEAQFPSGTQVRVQQIIDHRSDPIEADVTGVVEAWEESPTGSWHAHGKDGKLCLTRLKLRKEDGELTLLVIDDTTTVTKLDQESSRPGG